MNMKQILKEFSTNDVRGMNHQQAKNYIFAMFILYEAKVFDVINWYECAPVVDVVLKSIHDNPNNYDLWLQDGLQKSYAFDYGADARNLKTAIEDVIAVLREEDV